MTTKRCIIPIALVVFVFAWGEQAFGQERLLVIDQVGYLPDAAKWVHATGSPDSFFVHTEEADSIVFRGALTGFAGVDESTGMTVGRGEFTALQAEGTYYITSDSGDTTSHFRIAEDAYSEVYRSTLKGLYFQRCGTALRDPEAGGYTHPVCHEDDGVLHSSTDSSGQVESVGGWHDAGDFGKYVVPAGITVGTLLMGYEYFPDRFGSDNIGIPESGNGVPDILDEIRFELEWLLTMQRSDGGVYHKLTAENFSGMIMPHRHGNTRYIYEVSSAATGDFAAMMARAARVFESYDQQFSQILFIRASEAWNFLENNPNIIPDGGFNNPSGTYTGEYGDGYDRDERLWAAAELYEITGENRYHDYFLDHYDDITLMASNFGWNSVGTLAHLTYLRSAQEGADADVKAELESALRNQCDNVVDIRNQSGFRTAIEPGDFYWGSNSLAMNRGVLLLMGFDTFAGTSYREAALDQLHYVLGVNAHDMTFVTGIGERSPMHIHHRQSEADNITAPVPGLLAGGPNEYLQDDALREEFDDNTPPALCYVDDLDSYASNEITVYWNAPLTFIAGVLHPVDTTSTGLPGKSGSVVPPGIRLHHNFPNPFNGSTTIRFTLERSESIAMRVYNVQGKQVQSASLGRFRAGEHEISWQPHSLSSGVYFLRLEGETRSSMQKITLLK